MSYEKGWLVELAG